MNDSFDFMYDSLTTTIKSNFDNKLRLKTDANSFFIVHQNIRSLRQNFDTLIGNLEAFVNLPELIFVSEVWIYSYEVADYSIPNYKFYVNANDNYSAGGVGVFVKNVYECEVKNISFGGADIINVQCRIQNEPFSFVCVYRLQSSSPYIFLNEFSALLADEKCRNFIVLGDLNIDILDSSFISDSYEAIMAENGLRSFVNEPTRPSSGTCLDHVFGRFANIQLHLLAGINLNLGITDHCMTGLLIESIQCVQPRNSLNSFTTKINFNELNIRLRFENWDCVMNENDTSRAYKLFLKVFQNHIHSSSSTVRP